MCTAFDIKNKDYKARERNIKESKLRIEYDIIIKGQNTLFILEFFIKDNIPHIETEIVYRNFKNRLTNKSKFLKIINDVSRTNH